jgi:hypothetical protein
MERSRRTLWLPLALVFLGGLSRRASAANEQDVDQLPSECAYVQCNSLPGDGNCSAAQACCGCDQSAPGGACYPNGCGGGSLPPPPQPTGTERSCADGVDDDQDGAIDCEDSDCRRINNFLVRVNGASTALDLVNNPFSFVAIANGVCGLTNLEIKWDFDDGSPLAAGAVVGHSFADPNVYTVRATATCQDCTLRTSTVTAKVARITLASPSGDPSAPSSASESNEFVYGPDPDGNVVLKVPVSATVMEGAPCVDHRQGNEQHPLARRTAEHQ